MVRMRPRAKGFLNFEKNEKSRRQKIGRDTYELTIESATKLQAIFRAHQHKNCVEELLQLKLSEQLKKKADELKLKEEALQEQQYVGWMSIVEKLPPSSLKGILKALHGKDARFELVIINDDWKRKSDLFDALKIFNGASKICLWNCMFDNKKITCTDSKRFSEALAKQKTLEELNLRNNGMNSLDAGKLFGALRSTNLRKIVFADNWISRGRWDSCDDNGNPIYHQNIQGCESLSSCIRAATQLQHLDLSSNFFGATGLTAIVGSKLSTIPLVTLDLSNNNISSKGCFALAHLLCACPQLNVLNLAGNDFKAKGLETLAQVLSLHSKLESLELSRNFLGVKGAHVISDIIKINGSLKSLTIQSNEFGTEGVVALIAGMKTSNKIVQLDLSGNWISENALVSISQFIQENTCLKSIRMRDMNLVRLQSAQPVYRKQEIRAVILPIESFLFSCLARNNTLKLIDLRMNQITHPMNTPKYVQHVIQGAIALRPGLYISLKTQLLVASLFIPFTNSDNKDKITSTVFKILAYTAETRQILI